MTSAAEGLVEKYGRPSSQPESLPQDGNFPPDSNWDVGFDNDTVIYRVSIDSNRRESAFIMYTQPDFGEKRNKESKAELQGDL
ncbi:hypothetical protein A4G19_03665 [Pasteurellaceae bacterium Macca]|nr:hypothetical protein [Pasteurellaceae bacterium Macca]